MPFTTRCWWRDYFLGIRSDGILVFRGRGCRSLERQATPAEQLILRPWLAPTKRRLEAVEDFIRRLASELRK